MNATDCIPNHGEVEYWQERAIMAEIQVKDIRATCDKLAEALKDVASCTDTNHRSQLCMCVNRAAEEVRAYEEFKADKGNAHQTKGD